MTLFWIICALLLAVALLFIVPPLWRGTGKNHQVRRDAANLEVFRSQLAEIDTDLQNGLLAPELYEQGKRELQARLLEEVKPPEESGNLPLRNPSKTVAITLAILLPLAAMGLYWKIGNRDAFLPQAGGNSADGFGTARSETALKELLDKLAQNPQDKESLLLLARSYVEMERYTDAAKAYDTLTKLAPNEARLWADFAEALAMANGQSLSGHPSLLLGKALEIDPNNDKALALAGSAAMELGDFAAGIRYWETLLKQVPAGSDDAKMIEGGIRQAREAIAEPQGGKSAVAQRTPAAGEKKPSGEGKERITGTVTLSAALAGEARPDDALFVLARTAEGPKAPLAVVRKQVKDLPLEFALDDSMAMSPQLKLSGFGKVVVVARISKSGDAVAQPGDLQGMTPILKTGSRGVKLNIDNVVK